MAYWFIPFKSYNGDDYTIRIAGATSATPITLTGAAQPIVTQEDDDRDMFKPVRLQSGYIRIADTGQTATGATFDWHDLMPTSAVDRPVQLLKYSGGGYNVVWQGFIQPETFSGQYKTIPQEREFPIYCPFSALEAFDVNVADDNNLHNFAWLILYLLDHYYNIEITTFYFSRPQNIDAWLRTCWQRSNFFDDDGEPRFNGLQLLEEICKFWGWTARIDGTSIYFLQPDDTTAPNLAQLSLVDMQDIADKVGIEVTSVGWASRTVVGRTIFADSGEEYIPGIKNIKLEADINKRDDVLVVPMDEWADDYRTETITTTSQDDQYNFLLYDSAQHWDGNFFIQEEDDMWLTFQLDNGTTPRWGALVVEEFYQGDIRDKHNYNLAGRIHLRAPSYTPTATNWMVRIVSKRFYNLAEGVLVINGRRVSPNWTSIQYPAWLYMAVKIGNYYYHPTPRAGVGYWDASFDYITMEWDTSQIIDKRVLDGPYMPYTGYGCFIDSPRGGLLEILIYGAQVNDFDISSLEFSFVRRKVDSLPNTDDKNTYEVKGNAAFQEDVNLTTIFATNNNNERGLGIITDQQGYYLSTLDYTTGSTTTAKHPEQHLVDRIASYGGDTKKVLTLNTRNATALPYSWTPDSKVTDTDSRQYTPVSISHDWADDVTNYTLLEI